MADYNVNMKQWNGTSFDNVLPLAYNAKQLGGQSLAEVKQWVQDNGLLLYTGQYTGTGTYGKNNPTSVTFPFEVIALVTPQCFLSALQSQFSTNVPLILANNLTNDYQIIYYYTDSGTHQLKMKISTDKKTISWYSLSDERQQMNISGYRYNFAAIGGHDIGGATEWVITSSGSWIVPRTGRYYLELYGGGGGVSNTNEISRGKAVQGGSSCQSYSSISLTAGDSIAVTIGVGGSYRADSLTYPATGTSFGTYSVDGGGTGDGRTPTGGSGSGNLGTAGSVISYSTTNKYNNNNGTFGSLYGVGGWGGLSSSSNSGKSGTAGAVYLKYLGA